MWAKPYLAAVAIVLMAVGLRVALSPVWGANYPFLLFHPAVIVAAWFGGFGPGLLALGLSAAASWYFRDPAGLAPPSWADALALVAFGAMNVLLVAMVGMMHRRRREAEAARDAARLGEERLAAALEVGLVGVWDLDLTRAGAIWSDTYFDHQSAAKPPALASWRQRVHPDDVERVTAEFLGARDGRRDYRCEHRVVRPSGETRWINARGKFAYDATGRPVRLVGAFVDVTEGKAAHDEARANAARFRSIMASMDEGLYTVDVNGAVTFMNAAAERHFGWTAAELLGSQIHEVTHCRRPDGRPFPAEEVLVTGTPLTNQEDFFLRRDGSFFPVVYSSARAEVDGHPLGLVVVFRDVTEERQSWLEREDLLAITERARAEAESARDAAEAASHAKDAFLATVSHELRTPLSPILTWAGLLREGTLDDEKTRHAYEVIERSARTQAQLIEDLLDVSRIIAGRMRLEVRPVLLSTVIERAGDVVRPAADAKGVRLQLVLDPEAGSVLGDAGRLQQVVWNLLSNAVKFTPHDGRIQVTLERVGLHVEVTVADTGQGIEPVFLPHVFDRFQQADGTTTRMHGGLGLGLAIVRHIVEAHGGNVRVESPGVGKGAVFTVRIPLLVPRGTEERLPPMVAGREAVTYARLDGIRILVVDDEPDANQAIGELLASRGAEVRVADSAPQAREILTVWRPDVMVSDIGMPGEDGYGLIRKIRQTDGDVARTPAVALTAYASREDKIRVLTAGFHAHVPKPVDPAELVTVLANVARARRS
jgi:PAS domain S-box-containing protein